MITDPWFYAVCHSGRHFLFGISKGGFGGGLGMLSVPLMALVMSPVQAAAILLPLLCLMDVVSLWEFRFKWIVPRTPESCCPARSIGIVIGTLLFEYHEPRLSCDLSSAYRRRMVHHRLLA